MGPGTEPSVGLGMEPSVEPGTEPGIGLTEANPEACLAEGLEAEEWAVVVSMATTAGQLRAT